MSHVGAFPGIQDPRRRTIRAPVNPIDKCTVVSIFSKHIDEKKPTIEPGRFIIKSGTYEMPSLLVVGSSSWWKEIDEHQPLLEIPNSSIQVADSIVKDYCNGFFGCNMSDAMPGLFWLPGEINLITLRAKHKAELDVAKFKQDNFFKNIVKLTDALWARTNGNPLVVSDEARLAARTLQLEDKAWMKDSIKFDQQNCPACGFMRNPAYPVCSNCHNVIDKEKARELGIAFTDVKK